MVSQIEHLHCSLFISQNNHGKQRGLYILIAPSFGGDIIC